MGLGGILRAVNWDVLDRITRGCIPNVIVSIPNNWVTSFVSSAFFEGGALLKKLAYALQYWVVRERLTEEMGVKSIFYSLVFVLALVGCSEKKPVLVSPVSGTSYNLSDASFQLFDVVLDDGNYNNTTITFEWVGGREPQEVTCSGGTNVIARCMRRYTGSYQSFNYSTLNYVLLIRAKRGNEETVALIEFKYGNGTGNPTNQNVPLTFP